MSAPMLSSFGREELEWLEGVLGYHPPGNDQGDRIAWRERVRIPEDLRPRRGRADAGRGGGAVAPPPAPDHRHDHHGRPGRRAGPDLDRPRRGPAVPERPGV